MSTHISRRLLIGIGLVVTLAIAPQVSAADGFMAFLQNGPTGTTVVTGTAESYMRAGRDWDKNDPGSIIGGIAVPKLIQNTRITTWSDAAGIHFHFEIPDVTRTNTSTTTSTLACGDQIILQFSPSAATTTLTGPERRFEIVVNSNGAVTWQTRSPNALGKWSASATALTPIPTATIVSNEYRFTLDITWAQANLPVNADFRLALALINDLGHSGAPPVNEASGTAFPVGMGLTPESDPFISCGTATTPNQETANGNWIKPNTWGTGFITLSTTPNVSFDQGPAGWLSRAIRIGRCDVTDFNQITEATTANWVSDQTTLANNWYKFNAQNPCRMTIWMNATVSPPGTTQRRFLVVWGRPGISPQAWYFAGMTEPVTVSSPSSAPSFVWKKPTAVAGGLSDHPCLRVYALPASLSPAQQAAVTALAMDTTAAGGLGAFETAFASWASANPGWTAQMNFANYDNNSSCSETNCMPIASVIGPDRWSPFVTLHAQPSQPQVGDRPRPGDDRQGAVRIIAHAFGVADPQGNKPYTFIEDIGGLGWVVSNQVLAQTETIALNMQVSNPAITEKLYVDGTPLEVPSPNRRILVATVVDGTPAPRIDLSALNRFAETPLTPGQTFDSQIVIFAVGGPPWWVKWWWVILLVLLIIAIILYLVRRPATP